MSMKKDFGEITPGKIYSLSATNDCKYCLVSDSKGHLKQIDITNIQEEVYDYGKIHPAGIFTIQTTPDSRYLFSADIQGNLFKISIRDKTLIQKYEKLHDSGILTIGISPDGNYLYSGDENGNLKQLCISWKNAEIKYTNRVINQTKSSIFEQTGRSSLSARDIIKKGRGNSYREIHSKTTDLKRGRHFLAESQALPLQQVNLLVKNLE